MCGQIQKAALNNKVSCNDRAGLVLAHHLILLKSILQSTGFIHQDVLRVSDRPDYGKKHTKGDGKDGDEFLDKSETLSLLCVGLPISPFEGPEEANGT